MNSNFTKNDFPKIRGDSNPNESTDEREITDIAGYDEKNRDLSEFNGAKRALFTNRKRVCPLKKVVNTITYKNPDLLRKYTSERGKILSARITFVSVQRKLKKEIKRARFLALLPYINS